MTSKDLFELAALDALGMLDDNERAEFERAFRAAPPHLQAQIRREQVRAADLERLLPDVEPPAGLRARVLAAVRDAMGTLRPEPASNTGFIPGPAISPAAFWRASCIAFATATVVLAAATFMISDTNRSIREDALSVQSARELASIGGNHAMDLILASNKHEYRFQPAPAAPDIDDARVAATLYVNPDTGAAQLFCRGLPITTGEYTLVISSDQIGKRTERFRATGGDIGIRIDNIVLTDDLSFEVRAPRRAGGQQGETLLVARNRA